MRLLDPAPAANLLLFSSLDSTNDMAERLMASWIAADEAPMPDTVVIAREQTTGHGQGSKQWASPRGGLYATWLGLVANEDLPMLPLAVGLACARAVEEVVPGVWVGLKWPNDLYVGSAKLGGILCHARTGNEGAWARVGFGINVATAPRLPAKDPVRTVCLADLGWTGDVQATTLALVGGFLRQVRAALAEPGTTRQEWVGRTIHRPGDALTLVQDGAEVHGRFVGFAPEGSLEIEVDDEVRRFASGELVLPLVSGGK
jgi:BirA family transcriptional regulator, biotin operon repressor / biotin---[acetyl-CoA-carboxylase] ligase